MLTTLLLATPATTPATSVAAALQRVADRVSAQYGLSVAAAFHSPKMQVAVAAGHTDAGLGMGMPKRRAQPDDEYVWGSITKMFTAPAVLQLVEKGTVALDDTAAQHVDPMLAANGTSFSTLFGAEAAAAVRIKHLLHMTSGIPDYDGEAYAEAQFGSRARDFDPLTIVVDYVRPRKLEFAPGTKQRYCSTNYILLGLVLATHLAAPSGDWRGYEQMSVVPSALRLRHSRFVDAGTCEQATVVHGFMDGYSTASLPPQDVWNVSCVGGWSAGNYVGSVADLAAYTYTLYSPASEAAVVGAASVRRMLNFSAPASGHSHHSGGFYGMGTFNLAWAVGTDGTAAYGHVGDTYGYQSQTTYLPGDDFVLSVATNAETSSQAQPADFTCSAYHEVLAALHGTTPPNCTFVVPYRFIGTCTCTPAAAPADGVLVEVA